MYKILLVDDELPALRFLDTIITNYAEGFQVINSLRDGASALEWIKNNLSDIDVLITDIRMPDMDGISLAKAARDLMPKLHIVIVSGYQEFDYAHGAIEAAVDDYILKPVSVSHMKELLEKIRKQLDQNRKADLPAELTALLNMQSYNYDYISSYYGSGNYFFALLRIGNVLYTQNKSIIARLADSDLFCCKEPDITVLQAKDDHEFLIYAPARGSIASFQTLIRQKADETTCAYTLIFAQSAMGIHSFGLFYENASKILRNRAIIGHSTEIVMNDNSSDPAAVSKPLNLQPVVLKQLEMYVNDNNLKSLHQLFASLGNEWDKDQITQRQAYVLMHQILHLVEAVRHDHIKSTDQIMSEADQLTDTAESYRSLTEGLYSVLFDESRACSSKMTPEDMYNYAINAIHNNFNQAINIQTICTEIGISQTYMSRLFRKFGNTSFNSYLVNCRIENACRMIKEHPQIPLNQVSSCVGYEEYAYFSKVFRQQVGCSPSQYQADLQNNAGD